MNVHPEDQRTLLSVRECDTRLVQLDHQRTHLPQIAAIAEIDAVERERARDALEAQTALEQAQTELDRLAADVAVVTARIARDTEREQQSGNAKEVEAFEHEIASLRLRLSAIEQDQLEALERVELAEQAVVEAREAAAERARTRDSLAQELAAAEERLLSERATVEAERRRLAATLGDELISLYERKVARGGQGVGLLRQKTCGACSIVLTGADLERIRQTPADELAECPDCTALLVRTEESGL